MMLPRPDLNRYKKFFSEGNLWEKLGRFAKVAGQKTVYTVLLLFYAFRRKETPMWAKNIVIGTIGYFLAPIDFVPDLTPVLGYTDDLSVLSLGLVMIAGYVNDEVKSKARKRMTSWFGSYDEPALEEVDQQL
jgi:uncharacterized membrane protein YkvA (DUF1232 family)